MPQITSKETISTAPSVGLANPRHPQEPARGSWIAIQADPTAPKKNMPDLVMGSVGDVAGSEDVVEAGFLGVRTT